MKVRRSWSLLKSPKSPRSFGLWLPPMDFSEVRSRKFCQLGSTLISTDWQEATALQVYPRPFQVGHPLARLAAGLGPLLHPRANQANRKEAAVQDFHTHSVAILHWQWDKSPHRTSNVPTIHRLKWASSTRKGSLRSPDRQLDDGDTAPDSLNGREYLLLVLLSGARPAFTSHRSFHYRNSWSSTTTTSPASRATLLDCSLKHRASCASIRSCRCLTNTWTLIALLVA